MGAVELKFDGTFEKDNHLKDFQCPHCRQPITEQDISQKNYMLWVSDYANEVEKSEFFSGRLSQNLTCYNLTFWLKSVEHEYCPDTERCQGCYQTFLMEKLSKSPEDYYYCVNCRLEAGFSEEEVNHE